MESAMPINSIRPIPGTEAYWQDRTQAFALVRKLEKAIEVRNRAPLYLAGPGYDPEDNSDDVIENIGPWERVAALQDQARNNPTVMEILTAQGRLTLLEV